MTTGHARIDNERQITAASVAATGAIMDDDFPISGLMVRLADGSYLARDIVGTANEIKVEEGNAVLGSPQVGFVTDPILPGAPTISDFTNAAHAHGDAANGGALAAKLRTVTLTLELDNPVAGDTRSVTFLANAATFVQVRGVTDAGTVDFNIEYRATDTPDVAGTDILTADLQATAGGANTTTFNASGVVAAETWLTLVASADAGGPTKLWVVIEYVVN